MIIDNKLLLLSSVVYENMIWKETLEENNAVPEMLKFHKHSIT